MIRTGDLLDDTYMIKEKIGSGGGGIIYKAYHCRLKKDVVIKLIKNEIRGRINERSEVDILKNLKHTYLPQVYDFVTDGDDVYTVMDYIPGQSLSDELKKRKRFPQKKVIKWAIQLCEAISYLHSRNIPVIHSDIKPDNIMLTPEDNICLIDFNVSLLFNNDVNVVGFSEGYSPPEQVSIYNVLDRMNIPQIIKNNNDAAKTVLADLNCGKSKSDIKGVKCKVDVRSDVYSLGATLYHLIVGEKPEGAHEDITPIDSYNIKIGHSIKQIIKKAMNKDIEERYKTIDDMLYDLNNINKYDKLYEKQIKRKKRLIIYIVLSMFVLFTAYMLCVMTL